MMNNRLCPLFCLETRAYLEVEPSTKRHLVGRQFGAGFGAITNALKAPANGVGVLGAQVLVLIINAQLPIFRHHPLHTTADGPAGV